MAARFWNERHGVVLGLGILVTIAAGICLFAPWVGRSLGVAASSPSAARPRLPNTLTARGVSHAAITVEEGKAVRLEVIGARLHIPAGAVRAGTEVELRSVPIDDSAFLSLEDRDSVLVPIFVVTGSRPGGPDEYMDLVVDLPPGRDNPNWVATGSWRPGTPRPGVAREIQHLPAGTNSVAGTLGVGDSIAFCVWAIPYEGPALQMSELDVPQGATFARALIREDRPTTLAVPGARLRLPPNTQRPGIFVELVSQPIQTSDFPVDGFPGERLLSPMITLRSFGAPAWQEERPIHLEFAIPPDVAYARVRYKTRTRPQGCLVDGPGHWDSNDGMPCPEDALVGGTFTLANLPAWYSFVAVEPPKDEIELRNALDRICDEDRLSRSREAVSAESAR